LVPQFLQVFTLSRIFALLIVYYTATEIYTNTIRRNAKKLSHTTPNNHLVAANLNSIQTIQHHQHIELKSSNLIHVLIRTFLPPI
jgi:hypothetical protein